MLVAIHSIFKNIRLYLLTMIIYKCQKFLFIDIIRSIVKQPTAPFCEGYVKSSVYRFLDNYPLLKYSEDQHGNILIKYDGNTSRKVHRSILTAHLDHPGFRWKKST